MSELFNYRKAKILFVDDEELTRKYFERNFRDTFDIITAADAKSAREILDKDPDAFGILVTDQRMPETTGVELLEFARKRCPRTLRMLITAYADMEDTVAAINSGAVYKYISKPYEDFDLELTLKRAMEFYLIQLERDLLLREKFAAMHRSILTERVLSMGVLAAGISHHLRNSLTAVRAFLDLAPSKLNEEKIHYERMNDASFWKELHDTAQQQVQKVVNFLQDIECYVTVQAPEFKDQIDLKQLIQESMVPHKDLFSSKKISFDLDKIDEGIELTVNQKLLLQAFSLLFQERARFLRGNTTVQLSSRKIPGNDTTPEHIHIEIQDPGTFMAAEELAQLFDPFRINPDRPSELGIHLLGAFFLIYHHGGLLQFESTGEQGIRFSISLPLDSSHPLETSSQEDFLNKIFQLERLWEEHLLES